METALGMPQPWRSWGYEMVMVWRGICMSKASKCLMISCAADSNAMWMQLQNVVYLLLHWLAKVWHWYIFVSYMYNCICTCEISCSWCSISVTNLKSMHTKPYVSACRRQHKHIKGKVTSKLLVKYILVPDTPRSKRHSGQHSTPATRIQW